MKNYAKDSTILCDSLRYSFIGVRFTTTDSRSYYN